MHNNLLYTFETLNEDLMNLIKTIDSTSFAEHHFKIET
jgi:hypothetical protein